MVEGGQSDKGEGGDVGWWCRVMQGDKSGDIR